MSASQYICDVSLFVGIFEATTKLPVAWPLTLLQLEHNSIFVEPVNLPSGPRQDAAYQTQARRHAGTQHISANPITPT